MSKIEMKIWAIPLSVSLLILIKTIIHFIIDPDFLVDGLYVFGRTLIWLIVAAFLVRVLIFTICNWRDL